MADYTLKVKPTKEVIDCLIRNNYVPIEQGKIDTSAIYIRIYFDVKRYKYVGGMPYCVEPDVVIQIMHYIEIGLPLPTCFELMGEFI